MEPCNEKESRERLRDDCHKNWVFALVVDIFYLNFIWLPPKEQIGNLVWITINISEDWMDTRVTIEFIRLNQCNRLNQSLNQ